MKELTYKQRLTVIFVALAAVALTLTACVGGGASAAAASKSAAASASEEAVETPEVALYFMESLGGSPEAFARVADALPAEEGVHAFALLEGSPAEAAADGLEHIQAAVDEYPYDVAFAMVDLASGQGVCYNAHELHYGASSMKAGFAAYLCSRLVESGALELSDCTGAWGLDYDLAHPEHWNGTFTVGSLVENTIIYSDNTAYETLRGSYEYLDYAAYTQWMKDLGLEDLMYCYNNWYPDYTPAQGVSLWLYLWSYLQSGTETAQWLAGLLGETEVSFLRAGLGESAQLVLNKAGWDVGGGFYNTLTDCGVVIMGDRTYVVALMVNEADGAEDFGAITQLARTLVQETNAALASGAA